MKSKNLVSILHQTRAHLGHKHWHPRTAEYLIGFRNGGSVFQIEQTIRHLQQALKFLFLFSQHNGHILFVTTDSRYSSLLKTTALLCGQSYVDTKWIGGTLTNWSETIRSLRLYRRFQTRFQHFLKKRNISFSLYQRAQDRFAGFSTEKIPDLIILLNPHENDTLLCEATTLKIPVLALVDSNTNPLFITYPIPGNDDSIDFIYYFLNLVTKTIRAAKKNEFIS